MVEISILTLVVICIHYSHTLTNSRQRNFHIVAANNTLMKGLDNINSVKSLHDG